MKIKEIISQLNTMTMAFGVEATVVDVIAQGGYDEAVTILRKDLGIELREVLPQNIWELKVKQERLAELNRAIIEYSLLGISPNREWLLESEHLTEYINSRIG